MSDPKPKVLVVGPAGEGIIGGVASFTRSHLQNRRLLERFDLRALDTGTGGGVLPARLIKSLRLVIRLTAAILTQRPRIVHLHCSSGGSFYEKSFLAVICRTLGCRTLLHLHGGAFARFFDTSRLQGLIRFLLGRPDLVAAVSPAWQKYLAPICRAATAVVPNCAAYRFFALEADPESNADVLFVGELRPEKGIPELLEACDRLRGKGIRNRFRLAVTRQKSMSEQTLAGANRQGIDLVTDAGQEEIAALLGCSAVFVLPSRLEGLPIAMLEAMAAGVPVVATRVGGIPDAVDDGVEGFLVEAGDSAELADRLGRLLADGALRKTMGARARQRALRDYHPDVSGEILAGLYLRLSGSSEFSRSAPGAKPPV